jgi:DNA-binding NtrC family response regulator
MSGVPMNGERLLVVDDEAALLQLLRRYLERLGYRVDTAATAEDALTQFSASPNDYAAIVTDMTLPGMNGEELLERMRTVRPGVPALISSGYPYEARSAATGFLQKPYLPAMLAEALERLLKRRRSKD